MSNYSNVRLSFVDLRWAQLYVSLVSPSCSSGYCFISISCWQDGADFNVATVWVLFSHKRCLAVRGCSGNLSSHPTTAGICAANGKTPFFVVSLSAWLFIWFLRNQTDFCLYDIIFIWFSGPKIATFLNKQETSLPLLKRVTPHNPPPWPASRSDHIREYPHIVNNDAPLKVNNMRQGR